MFQRRPWFPQDQTRVYHQSACLPMHFEGVYMCVCMCTGECDINSTCVFMPPVYIGVTQFMLTTKSGVPSESFMLSPLFSFKKGCVLQYWKRGLHLCTHIPKCVNTSLFYTFDSLANGVFSVFAQGAKTLGSFHK
jgi:hypothetical protein